MTHRALELRFFPPPPKTPRITVIEHSVAKQSSPRHTPGGTQVLSGLPPPIPPSLQEAGSSWVEELKHYEWVPQGQDQVHLLLG